MCDCVKHFTMADVYKTTGPFSGIDIAMGNYFLRFSWNSYGRNECSSYFKIVYVRYLISIIDGESISRFGPRFILF